MGLHKFGAWKIFVIEHPPTPHRRSLWLRDRGDLRQVLLQSGLLFTAALRDRACRSPDRLDEKLLHRLVGRPRTVRADRRESRKGLMARGTEIGPQI